MVYQKLYSKRIQLLLVFAGLTCSSTYNTVKLHPAREGQDAYLRLLTTHYVAVNGNLVAEYDRGERSAEFELMAPAAETGKPKVKVKLMLYFDDPPLSTNAELEAGNEVIPVGLLNLQRETKEELATVLDTGQRSEFMPPMGNDVQAQSGYITFGKPAGAGTAKRRWRIYTFEAGLPANIRTLVTAQNAVTLRFSLAGKPATAVIDGKERAAWLRFFDGRVDQAAEK